MATQIATLKRARPAIAWNDIEALPLYAAFIIGAAFLWFAFTDLTPTVRTTTLKVVGIMGCLALRHAWLKLDDDVPARS
ncbi:hypothetical protein [Sphingomonas sp.]|uniref:hypothetical protein n=1 Tax=Sphingomonas sp. TaxID=28214 RepID=UPI003B3A36E2